jgi:hypothetical protein
MHKDSLNMRYLGVVAQFVAKLFPKDRISVVLRFLLAEVRHLHYNHTHIHIHIHIHIYISYKITHQIGDCPNTQNRNASFIKGKNERA